MPITPTFSGTLAVYCKEEPQSAHVFSRMANEILPNKNSAKGSSPQAVLFCDVHTTVKNEEGKERPISTYILTMPKGSEIPAIRDIKSDLLNQPNTWIETPQANYLYLPTLHKQTHRIEQLIMKAVRNGTEDLSKLLQRLRRRQSWEKK